jgi:hypothetical protein
LKEEPDDHYFFDLDYTHCIQRPSYDDDSDVDYNDCLQTEQNLNANWEIRSKRLLQMTNEELDAVDTLTKELVPRERGGKLHRLESEQIWV